MKTHMCVLTSAPVAVRVSHAANVNTVMAGTSAKPWTVQDFDNARKALAIFRRYPLARAIDESKIARGNPWDIINKLLQPAHFRRATAVLKDLGMDLRGATLLHIKSPGAKDLTGGASVAEIGDEAEERLKMMQPLFDYAKACNGS